MAEGRFRRIALLVAVAGTLHGLVYTPLVTVHAVTDSGSYLAAASAIEDGSYTTPLIAGFYYTHPVGFFDITGVRLPRSIGDAPERQAFRPPGYPLFLAAVGGGGAGPSEWAAMVGQALLFGAGVWLLALTVRRWWGPRPGLLAAGLYALDPYSKHYVSLILAEALTGLVLLAAAYTFTRWWQSRSLPWLAGTGAFLGALTLVRAVFVLAVPLLCLAAVLRSGPLRRRLEAAAVSAACAVLPLVPWLAWTNAVTGKAALANYGQGYNLLVAAHGEGLGRTQTEVARDPAFLRDTALAQRSFPSRAALLTDPEAHPRYVARADATMRERAWSEYGDRLASEPERVAWEVVYRMYFLWNAHEDWYQPSAALLFLRIADWITIVLGALGLGLAIARGGAARPIAIFLLAYTAVMGVHHVEARFAMPLRGLFLAFAALALLELLTRARVYARRTNPPSRRTQSQNVGEAGAPADVTYD